MRCKTCNYTLWQIRDRRCPECGSGFKPSDFEFVCNSVRFCCPHCNQDYYGTGEKGHLVPASFACVRCAQPITMDETVLLPTEGVQEQQTETTVVPWVDKRDRSWFTAFFITMGQGISNPRRLMNAIPETSSFLRALVYGSLHIVLQAVMNLIGILLFMGLAAAIGGGSGMFAGIVGAALAVTLIGPVILLTWAGTAHAVLKLTGDTEFGFARTHQAIAYSAGNNFLCGVPCLGLHLSWAGGLWWAISAGFMLALAQRVRGLRAAFAVAMFPTLIVLGLAGLVTYWVIEAQRISASFPPPSTAGPLPTVEQTRMANFMTAFGSARAQQLKSVRHVAEVMPSTVAEFDSFVDPREPGASSSSVIMGGAPLSAWTETMSDSMRQSIANIAVNKTPAGPAYRVGDRVFTHAGIDFSKISSTDSSDQLWLVIGWRRSLKASSRAETVSVLRADLQVSEMSSADFDGFLESQNLLRQTLGLPPLPMPDTVIEHETAPATQSLPTAAPEPSDP